MRFFSSSALASAPKLRLAASCSAAETMRPVLRECQTRYRFGRVNFGLYRDQAACSLASRLAARISTLPPAFSTAATADFDAPYTERAILALSSPLPRTRTLSFPPPKIPPFPTPPPSTLPPPPTRPP